MANRKNTFLLKRSNIAGKIPSAGDLQLGELALNIADNILYASGTTANSILPIGWDRVARTGDTMTGGLFTPYLSATTISATTYLNLPPTTFSGGTVTGPTNFTNGLTANTMSATTYYGDGSNLTGISAVATEFVVNCRNQSGSNMYRGQVVYMNGSTGNKPTILLAQANSEMTSARTFGVLKNDIANNGDGDVVTIGSITNLDTRTSATHPFTIDTLSDGQTIYLSPTNAGYITNVKPYAPNHLVYIGKVVRTSPTNGYIEYQIQNGYELDELHDVKITGVTYGDLLTYSGYNGSNVWVNSKTLNGSYTITGNTNIGGGLTASTISASTVSGNNLYVTGGTQSWFSGDSSSDLVRITQTGSGNAFVVEDGTNPDGTPFVIDADGNVAIGNATPSSTNAKFTVQKSPTQGNIRLGGGNGIGNARLYLESDANNAYIDMYGNDVYLPLRIDASPLKLNTSAGSGNVGIGAETPSAKLHVNNTDNQNSFLVEDSNNPDGTPFVIDANGNVGMGTLTPQNVLHVKANPTSTGTATIRVESDASTANSSISYYSGGVHRWEAGTGISLGAPYEIYDRVGGQPRFSITTSGASVFSNGNVGIGTTTPTSTLSVLKGTQSDTISVSNSAAWIGGVDVGLAIGQSASAPYGTWLQSIRPSDDATFPLLLNPSGSSVGIGITVPLATLHTRTVAVPSAGETIAQFDVSDDTSSYLRIYNSTTVDASFVPTLEGKNSAATVALGFIGNATLDTGNEPITLFDSRFESAAVVTRPLFQWDNFGAAKMTMLANGNLGLGVTNPTEKLVVNGNAIITGSITVTGGTQSLFSGNSSVEMVKIIQAGSGDAFVVQDQANGDTSHFVINASGNTAIGLTAPIGNDKLTVSGNTTIYGTLSASTYAGLPNAGVLVVPIATSSVAIGTGSNDYYLNFKIPYNLTISKVDFSVSTAGSDSVRIGIYRGQDLTAVLVGQSAGGTVSTLNSVPIVAEVGQNLTFSAGSWIVIGVAVGGTTTNLYGSACPVNNLIAWTNTTDSSGGFQTNPRSKAATRTSFPSIEITVA